MHSGTTPTPPTTAARPDPYGAMLRWGAVPAFVVGVVAVGVATAVQGSLGAAGAALATVLVLVSSASTLVFLRRMAGLDPRVVFLGAMVATSSRSRCWASSSSSSATSTGSPRWPSP